MMLQRGQMLIQVVHIDKFPLTDIATVDIFGVEKPPWVDGSTVLYHNVSVQRGLVTKVLLAYLAKYPSVDLVVEMLIQSVLADEVLLAVTAPKLGGMEGFEVFDCCGFSLEGHLTFVTITVLFSVDALQGHVAQREMSFCMCHISIQIPR